MNARPASTFSSLASKRRITKMTAITRVDEIVWLKDTISEYKQHIKECQAYLDACNSRLDELTRLDELNGENHD